MSSTFNASRLSEVLEMADLSKTAHPRPELSNEYTAPRNETEQTLVDIWQKSLSIEQVGIHDNFFELGGDSLLGTQVFSRVREAFQVNIPIGTLFEEPTVAGLARLIETINWATQESRAPESITEYEEEGEI